LETLFVFQTNEAGIWMAAFTTKDPTDKAAYMKQWSAIVDNPAMKMETMRVNNAIVGSFIHFDVKGKTNVSYWIDQQHWGKGWCTKGLQQFLENATKRPLYAWVAFDNYGSQKVLEKCGFKIIEKEKSFSNVRKKEIEEFVYLLE